MKNKIVIKNDCRDLMPDEIVEAILLERGILDIDEFVYPSYKHQLSPFELKNMEEAVKIGKEIINNDYPLLIYADTDLDGCSSAAIIYRYFNNYITDIKTFINRGKVHGVTKEFLELKDKPKHIIIVDSLNYDPYYYRKLKENGHVVIVLDHHDISDINNYKDYITLVSSQNDYPNKDLCGAGVCLKFAQAMDEVMKREYSTELTTLAAAGEISDMMRVDSDHMENRSIVHIGLRDDNSYACNKMVGTFGMNGNSIAFSVAPLINAAVRTGNGELALKTFITDDEKEIKECIKKLKKCKDQQNIIVDSYWDSVLEQLNEQINEKVIFINLNSQIPNEMTGLFGNKLLSIANRPVIIYKEENGLCSGSGRGVGIDDFRMICEQTGLCSPAGHPLSFGIMFGSNCKEEFFGKLRKSLENVEFEAKFEVDALVDIEQIGDNLISKLKDVNRITGNGFGQLNFCVDINDYTISNMSGGKHLKIVTDDMIFVEWNTNCDWERLEDAALLGETIRCIGTLSSAYYGKTRYNQMIMSHYEILEE